MPEQHKESLGIVELNNVCKTFIAPEALFQFGMDNLKLRRILAAVDIVIIVVAFILLIYGIFIRNNTYILISIASVVIAYLISRYVMRLQKENRAGKK